MKRVYKILLSALLMITVMRFPYDLHCTQQILSSDLNFVHIDNQIQPYKDVVKWKYKIIGGKMYKRQYNATTGEWIGEWELIPGQ